MKIEVEWCKAASQQIRLISEGSCDTEAWSKDAENSGMNYILNIYFTLVRIREFLQKPYRPQT